MSSFEDALAVTRGFVTTDVETRMIDEIAAMLRYHPGTRFDPRDEDTAFARLFVARRPANPGFNLRLEFILQWIAERKEEALDAVTRPIAFSVDWSMEQGFLVSPSARALIEAHCAAGVGVWTVSQEYRSGVMLCSGYARHAVRAKTVGMRWRRANGERRARWHAVA